MATVSGIFEAAITSAFPGLVSGLEKDKWLKINPTSDAKFGDYQASWLEPPEKQMAIAEVMSNLDSRGTHTHTDHTNTHTHTPGRHCD